MHAGFAGLVGGVGVGELAVASDYNGLFALQTEELIAVFTALHT